MGVSIDLVITSYLIELERFKPVEISDIQLTIHTLIKLTGTLEGDLIMKITRVKATFHLTIFDILMRPVREDQRHRRRFTR